MKKPKSEPMNPCIAELLVLLQLEKLEVNLFRGQSRNIVGKNVFGGQVLGQCLMAAGLTVEKERVAHSLHGYFLRAGDTTAPIIYEVDRIRDGKSFVNRQVTAIQHGQPIFVCSASFTTQEEGLDHQAPMPQVEGPEGLPNEFELRQQLASLLPEKIRNSFVQERPIEIRPINPVNPFAPTKQEAHRYHWMRAQDKLPDDLLLHQAALVFASDFALMGTAMLPHAVTFMQSNLQAASLDHSIWFHRPFRMDEWLLYEMDAPNANGGRGLNFGRIFSQDGRLVASTAQEGLMRLREVPEKY
ncbi:MAG: acyl-CoA thioesterase II [Agitococcus sp.]